MYVAYTVLHVSILQVDCFCVCSLPKH